VKAASLDAAFFIYPYLHFSLNIYNPALFPFSLFTPTILPWAYSFRLLMRIYTVDKKSKI